MLHFLYYDMHFAERFELRLIFGFEESNCCLYFVVGASVYDVVVNKKMARSGISSADEFLAR